MVFHILMSFANYCLSYIYVIITVLVILCLPALLLKHFEEFKKREQLFARLEGSILILDKRPNDMAVCQTKLSLKDNQSSSFRTNG